MPQPQLGYGKPTEATVDQVNVWMRSQPWWQQIKGGGGDISDAQKRAILRAAQANGVVVDEGSMEIDKGGNLNPRGNKLKNTLIVAGIAGATIATMGAAGAFSGAAGAAGAGAGGTGAAAGAGGALGSTTIGTGMMGGIAGGTGLAGAGAGAGAAGAGTLAATQIGSGAIGPIAGGTGYTGGAAGAGGILGTTKDILSQGRGASGYLDTAGQIAGALGDYAGGRQDDRMAQGNFDLGYDRNAQYRYGNVLGQAQTDLNRKNYSLDAPGKRASNSVRGDILANAQDVSLNLPSTIPRTTISGGLRPSMFSDNTRQLGREMSTQALASQQAGDTFTDLPAPPALTAPPRATGLDSFLNTAATIGSMAGELNTQIPYGRVPQPGDPDYVPPQRRR